MILDEILTNLNESAVAGHPEDCDCEECQAKRAEEEAECVDGECIEECGDAQSFWKETGIDESENKELESLNAEMRKLMKKRSECASGSSKQEKINDKLDKIYDRRHELMSKKTLNEDGEGSKVLEALEDINDETELNEKNFKCDSAEYNYKSGKLSCDGKDITDEFFGSADKAGSKAAEKVKDVDEAQELYEEIAGALDEDLKGMVQTLKSVGKAAADTGKAVAKAYKEGNIGKDTKVNEGIAGTVGKAASKALSSDSAKAIGQAASNALNKTLGKVGAVGSAIGQAASSALNSSKPVEECSMKMNEYEGTTSNNAEAGAGIGADIGRWVGKGLDKAKEYGKQAIDYAGKEFNKAREALYKDVASSGLHEEDEKGPWDPENQDPEKRYMLDAVTEPVEEIQYDEADENYYAYLKRTNPEKYKDRKAATLAYMKQRAAARKADDSEEGDHARLKKTNAEKYKDRKAASYYKDKEAQECDECSESDESMYRVSKADGSKEYIIAESAEKFAEYINESFEDIVSFEKIDTAALNESMDHEVVDTIVSDMSDSDTVSIEELQDIVEDIIGDNMSEEFINTTLRKIINRLASMGIKVIE